MPEAFAIVERSIAGALPQPAGRPEAEGVAGLATVSAAADAAPEAPLPSYAVWIAAAGRLLALCLLVTFLSSHPAAARTLQIVAFGDSLSAGYGLGRPDAFPARLEAALKAKGYDVSVANAGVSGDTASAGLARLDWSVPQGTDAVIVELGANDMLRGVDPALTRRTLDDILTRLKGRNIPVLLAGMLAAPNYGADYKTAFDAIYPELAAKHGVLLYPFFLDGVTGNRALTLPDGLHPTAEGVERIVAAILPQVEKLIAQAQGAEAGSGR